MNKKLLIVILCTLSINTAWADDKTSKGIEYPKYLSVISGKEHSDISGKCDEVNDTSGDITCNFDERMVFHKNLENAKKHLANLKNKDAPEFKNELDLLKETCTDRPNKNDPKWLRELRKKCSNLQDTFSRDNLIQSAEDDLKKDELTCEIGAKSFTQRFHYNSYSHQWVYQSLPEGACGIIDIAYIEPVNKYSWKYTSRTIITNKSGIDPRGSCSVLINKEKDSVYYDNYGGNDDLTQLMNCKFIGFDTNYKWG